MIYIIPIGKRGGWIMNKKLFLFVGIAFFVAITTILFGVLSQKGEKKPEKQISKQDEEQAENWVAAMEKFESLSIEQIKLDFEIQKATYAKKDYSEVIQAAKQNLQKISQELDKAYQESEKEYSDKKMKEGIVQVNEKAKEILDQYKKDLEEYEKKLKKTE